MKAKRPFWVRVQGFVRRLRCARRGHGWRYDGGTVLTVDQRGPLRFEFERCDGCGAKRCICAPQERQIKTPNMVLTNSDANDSLEARAGKTKKREQTC